MRQGEPGVLALFEESPLKYLEQAHGFGIDLEAMTGAKMLKQVYVRPLDLSVDETLYEIQAAAGGRRETCGDRLAHRHAVSFMTNDIILQRYVEIDSQLRRIMTVVKTRSRKHSEDIRRYEITPQGIVVGERLDGYEGIIGGLPNRRPAGTAPYSGLVNREVLVLALLREARTADQDSLARQSGLAPPVVARALDRLVELEFADKLTANNSSMYRARPRRD